MATLIERHQLVSDRHRRGFCLAEIEIETALHRAAGAIATHRRLPYRWQLWLLLLPYLAGLSMLVVIPALVGLPLAFTDFNALQPPAFIGLENFIEMSG